MAGLAMLVKLQHIECISYPIRLCILGSTGSIGSSALELVRKHPDKFEIVALCAGSNIELLGHQIAEFKPRFVALGDESAAIRLRESLNIKDAPQILSGPQGISYLAALPEVDTVLAAMVGIVGLGPVLAALSAGKRVALANKESLVAGGTLVAEALSRGNGMILPVDSEHSALFQALLGHRPEDVFELILTASGGPFLNTPLEKLAKVTVQDALRHPIWGMGPKVTVDSATMMNKGLEIIEAAWLFGLEVDRIQVLVHPQSIVHSLVAFVDGAVMAELSVPDMKGPIAFALGFPGPRLPKVMPMLDLGSKGHLQFLPVDARRFPAVKLARECACSGKAATAVLNTANEVAVKWFLEERLSFTEIVPLVEKAVEHFGSRSFLEYEGLLDLDREVRMWLEAGHG